MPQSKSESERLSNLKSYDILDTPPEEAFDDIVELASEICEVPISLISLIDDHRQWFKAKIGLGVSETEREIAFCNHAIKQENLFEIEDTLNDDRFKQNPLVTGSPFIRSYAGFPLTTEDGFNLGTLCVIDNKPHKLNEKQKKALEVLSKRVVNELELRRKVQELKEVNEFKDKLLSIIGHDLRSPLNSIHSIIQLIDNNTLNEEQVKPLRKILSSEVQSSLNLLDNILNWSSLYLEGKEAIASNIKFKYLVDECITLLEYEVDKKGVRLNNKCDDTMAFGDIEMVKLVIRNILSNAIKYSKDGDTITITSKSLKHSSILKITDTGVGMTEEQVNRLLNKKGGYSAKGTSQEKGSGIGLLLSLEFLEVNNGKLSIESQLEVGSTFKITLPAAKPS
ncbi:MAG: GAF domain-containing sensor histidine kinase [Fulvivirga sp.]